MQGLKQFVLHELHNDHFHDEGRSEESCLSLHGGGSNAHWSGFGCDDGVLLIGELGEADHDHH